MTLLLPTDDSDRTTPLSQRLATSASRLLDRRRPGRRSFLRRAALVATALTVNPIDFVLKPQSAWASVCGPANECSQGWTAMCCTINAGANTCPEGSYAAGWWKVSSSAFCRGEDRYVVDCNRTPGETCTCRCAEGECDRRRVCCNNFRYGQCNQQVPGTTEVVCRIVICTPPWEWDESCTTTVRTDERTREHNATCLNPPNPTEIAVVYQDIGLVGSVVGAPVAEEVEGPRGGRWRAYEHGVITTVEAYGLIVAAGPAATAYRDRGGPDSTLGWIVEAPVDIDGGQRMRTEAGTLYAPSTGTAHVLSGTLEAAYQQRGGPAGWLGFPATDVVDAPGGRRRVFFAAGWSLAHDPSTDEVRLVPSDVELPDAPDEWYTTAAVERIEGPDRVATAVAVSAASHPDGADTVVLATAGAFADALAGGVLAGVRGGPVLLVATEDLSSATADELVRLAPSTVIVAGGAEAVADAVLDAVRDRLPDADVRRVAGDGRFATAVALAEEQVRTDEGEEASVDVVYVASGRTFPDALAVTPVAGTAEAPLLLTEPTELPDVTGDALRRWMPTEVVVAGGESAVSDDVVRAIRRAVPLATVRRIAGDGRFDTAVEAARELPRDLDRALVATGDRFADALSAGAAATADPSWLLLTSTDALPTATRHAIAELGPASLVVVGGTAAVSALVVEQLAASPNEPHEVREDPAAADTAGSPSGDEAPEPAPPPTLPGISGRGNGPR
ncbi:cell wall-binding repeat-containing protein [Euzebya rosea]|uniref:cell wall-binding repeat-containing protein n=1 Tax=Euzebya rosea TaxID=2052804 RepID=UPI000D3E93A9|nr:cell wall-binding repeat-containing protein [Euzebya rosea]